MKSAVYQDALKHDNSLMNILFQFNCFRHDPIVINISNCEFHSITKVSITKVRFKIQLTDTLGLGKVL